MKYDILVFQNPILLKLEICRPAGALYYLINLSKVSKSTFGNNKFGLDLKLGLGKKEFGLVDVNIFLLLKQQYIGHSIVNDCKDMSKGIACPDVEIGPGNGDNESKMIETRAVLWNLVLATLRKSLFEHLKCVPGLRITDALYPGRSLSALTCCYLGFKRNQNLSVPGYCLF